jgi:hypothetical protein
MDGALLPKTKSAQSSNNSSAKISDWFSLTRKV